MENNGNQKHTIRVANQPLSGSVHEKSVSDEDGSDLLTSRKTSITTEQGGKIYNVKPKDLAKAQKYWACKQAARKIPSNCGRCGQPNPDQTHKHCPACREYALRYKAGKAGKTVTIYANHLASLERRIGSLEHSLAMLQLNGRLMYKRGYAKGADIGREIRQYHNSLPTMSKQEAAAINHAYDRGHE